MRARSVIAAVLVFQSTAAADAQQPQSFQFSSVLVGNFHMRTDAAARAATGGEPLYRFDLTRSYLTFLFPAGDRASVRITADLFQQTNPENAAYYAGWSVRLKYGYLNYAASSRFAGVDDLRLGVRIGMLQTVINDHIETFWPRFLGITALEQAGFFATADLGAAATLTLPHRRGEVYLVVTNGNGFTSPETDRFKDVAARFTITPFASDSGWLRTLTVTPWYYKGWVASAYTQAASAVSEGLQKDRRGLFVGFGDRRLTLGAEFDQRLEELESTAPPAPRGPVNERTSQLVSAFAIVRPIEMLTGRRSRLALVTRHDRLEPDTGTDGYNEFLVGGVIWDLAQRVSLALDYQGSTPRRGAPGSPTNTWFLHWSATF